MLYKKIKKNWGKKKKWQKLINKIEKINIDSKVD